MASRRRSIPTDAEMHKDRVYIINQVKIAGFPRCIMYPNGLISMYINGGCVYADDLFKNNEWWFQTDNYRTEEKLTEEFIETHGWTMKQILVLDWIPFTKKDVRKYWRGESPFQTIEEVIDHLKVNSPRLFSTSLTKRAVSATTDADDASQAQ